MIREFAQNLYLLVEFITNKLHHFRLDIISSRTYNIELNITIWILDSTYCLHESLFGKEITDISHSLIFLFIGDICIWHINKVRCQEDLSLVFIFSVEEIQRITIQYPYLIVILQRFSQQPTNDTFIVIIIYQATIMTMEDCLDIMLTGNISQYDIPQASDTSTCRSVKDVIMLF